MFDTYYSNPSSVHVTSTSTNTTHEHRAPTAASVKLLTEMEKAALDRVLFTTRLDNIDLDVFVVVMQHCMDIDGREIVCHFKLNNKNVTVRSQISWRDIERASLAAGRLAMTELMDQVRDRVLVEIAKGILKQFPKGRT